MKKQTKPTFVEESQFGVTKHAQLQTLDGFRYEFQPEHLFCDQCWDQVDTAFAHASYFGAARACATQTAFEPKHDHSITVTKLGRVSTKKIASSSDQ